jgi:hypothetical protein
MACAIMLFSFVLVLSLHTAAPAVSAPATWKFCDSECSQRKSSIIIMGRGGLNERLSIFRKMSGVVNYLCAHLIIPSPFESLAARYNRYSFVSQNMTWEDLVVMQKSPHCDDKIITQSLTGSITDTNTDGLTVVNNVVDAVSCKSQNTPFVWTLHDEIMASSTPNNLLSNVTQHLQLDLLYRFRHRHPLPNHSSSSSSLSLSDLESSFEMAPLMLQHSARIMKNNHLTANDFIVFRVRRGDLKRTCNSELDVIPRVLEEALKGCPFYNSTTKSVSEDMSRVPVLFFSDEGSYIYRSEAMREIRQYGFQRTLDGDSLVQEFVRDELSEVFQNNNYVTFRIDTALQMQTRKLILMHGHHGCGHSSLCA